MSQRWLEISVRTDPSDADDVRFELSRWAGSALAIEQPADDAHGRVTVRAYIADGPDCMTIRHAIERALWHLGATGAAGLRAPRIRWVRPEQYLNQWRTFYRPFPIGRGFLVAPSWIDTPVNDRRVLRLDPGMAFGTGLHSTTQLAVEVLERAVAPGDTVMDVGTGSGILAIVAVLCGARSVCAIDVNLDAVRSARENTARNACDDRVAVIHGRLPISGQAPVDLLVANLVADAHLRNLDHFVAAVRRGGCLVLGGIEATRIADVRAGAADRGLRVAGTRRRDGWVCLTLRAPANPEASA